MADKKKVRVALIGAGGIAKAHAEAFKELGENVDFMAVCEPDEERGRIFQEKYGIPEFFRDYRDVLARDEIDIVSICTPSFNHSAITCEALRAGKWALCEKPVCTSIREADDILAAEHETGMRAASIFQMRFGRGIRALFDLIHSGRSGRPLIAACETLWYRGQEYYDEKPWRGTWEGASGGCLITLAIHIIDALIALFGEPERVSSEAANMNHRMEVEDCSVSTVSFRNGAMASIVATSCCHVGGYSSLKCVFEHLSAFMGGGFGKQPWTIKGSDVGTQKEIDACQARWRETTAAEDHSGQIAEFVQAYRNNTVPVVSINEARRTIELIAGIYKSSITGQSAVFPIAPEDAFYSSMNGGRMLRDDAGPA